jgi:hypothetical protein
MASGTTRNHMRRCGWIGRQQVNSYTNTRLMPTVGARYRTAY